MRKTVLAAACVALLLGPGIALAAEKSLPPNQKTAAAKPATKLTSGASDKEPVLDGSEIQISYAQRGQTLTVYVGRTIAVRLPGDREAGHSWDVTSLTGDAVKSRGKAEYVPNRDNPGRLPGAFIFNFEAVQPGRAKLKMAYHNPELEKKKNFKPNTFHVEFFVRHPPEKKTK